MKKLKKKKRNSKRRPVRYVRITPQRMRELEAMAAKRNPSKKKKKSKARKTRRPSARRASARRSSLRKPRRNISPLVAALVEGAGYTLGHEAIDSVTQSRKRKAARRAKASAHKTRKVKRNPTHGVAVGSRSHPRFIAAGPKAQIHNLARSLRAALGRSRNVMVGRVKSRSR